jgi:mono/diheme cytochrome c family protein
MIRWLASAVALVLVALGIGLWVHAGVGAPSTPDVLAGQALYARNCAVCHGPRGLGDGPSAVGFATKPANLADGRLLNALPDEFLINVILNGGPAEGLSSGMPPFRGLVGEDQARQIVAYVRTLAAPPFHPSAPRPLVVVPGAPAQPIFFSHLVHAGSFGIACQYCHSEARRSEYAGLPSVERCMGCHKIIGAQDNPEIRKVHDYWNRRAAIPWVRVFKLPEYAYFPHKAHIRAGLECQTCHGPIERMRVVGARTGRRIGNDLENLLGLKPTPPLLSMGWCVECHRAQNATRGMHAPLDCVTCHH